MSVHHQLFVFWGFDYKCKCNSVTLHHYHMWTPVIISAGSLESLSVRGHWKLWFIITRTQLASPVLSIRQNQSVLGLAHKCVLQSHTWCTHTLIQSLFRGFSKSGDRLSFWIIVVRVINVVSYVQVGYLSSVPKPHVAQRILSVIISKMAFNICAPVLVQDACVTPTAVFDKVLCIKVTITFITDVVYIFDILMFIPILWRREYV